MFVEKPCSFLYENMRNKCMTKRLNVSFGEGGGGLGAVGFQQVIIKDSKV